MTDRRVDPRFAAAANGELLIAGRPASAWVAEAGDTPLFVYDRAIVADRIAAFRATMPAGVQLHYAVKANPMPALVEWIGAKVDGLDVASVGELRLALSTGMDPTHVSFAGPGKRDRELAEAIAAGVTLNVESVGELERAARIADGLGLPLCAALRVNPDFELKGSGLRMGGRATPFGVDAVDAPAVLRRMRDLGVAFRGFHVYAGSQTLDAALVAEAQARTIDMVARLAEHAPAPPAVVNIGGGFGVPYFPNDRRLDVAQVGGALGDVLANRPLGDATVVIELGRWLVAECGVYLTRVIDRKASAGETFLVTDGGLHHQLAASGNFGTVIRRNYPLANASRFGAAAEETANVVGCLCTPLDRLGDKVSLPRTEPGDLIAVFMAGAYGRSASPAAFLGHPEAGEVLG